MNKEYFIDKDGTVILKKQMGQISQYSFNAHIWYSVPELKGIEDHPEIVTKISEQQANEYIKNVENMIKETKTRKTK